MEANNKRTKITITLLIVAGLLIATAVVLLQYNMMQKARSIAQNKIIADSTEVITKTTAEIEKNVEEIEASLSSLSKSADIERLFSGDDTASENIMKAFQGYMENRKEIKGVFIGTEYKQMLVYPIVELPEDYDPTVRPWYRSTVTNNELVWSEPYVDISNGDTIVTISLPIYNGNKLIGVLAADCKLNVIVEEIQQSQFKSGGYIYVTNQQNIVILHPEPAAVGQAVPIGQLKDLMLDKDAGHLIYKYNGLEKLTVYSKIDKLNLNLIGTTNTMP